MLFELVSSFSPAGDQPQAIDSLTRGIKDNMKHQTLLGVTGSGKTYTLANVIASVNKPTLVKLQIYHPQITGFQPVKIGGKGIPPAYYINTITASFNGKKIFSAETGYSISMDPAIGFYFVPDGAGTLKITATDTKGKIYEHLHELGGS